MTTIYKYQLELADSQHVMLPGGAKFLSVAMQNGHLCLWAEVETDHALVSRRIYIRGTGHQMGLASVGKYIGTAHDVQRGFVWHVFVGHEIE